MPSNIEIKARVANLKALKQNLSEVAGEPETVLHQHDIFFYSPTGRLKLRQIQHGTAELIYYDRPDTAGPKRSEYRRILLEHPDYFGELLSATLGMRGVVEKTRHLYRVGQTRVHLDRVIGLGDFIELEVVLEKGQSTEEGQRIAKKLMKQLGLRDNDMVDAAYIDLLETS